MFKLGLMALVALLAIPCAARAADVTGLWHTAEADGEILITRCGDSICGHAVTSAQLKANPAALDEKNPNPALRARPLKGLLILQGFQPAGDGWAGGAFYDPRSGMTYKGSVDPAGPDRIKVTGCVIVPICSSRYWTRVK